MASVPSTKWLRVLIILIYCLEREKEQEKGQRERDCVHGFNSSVIDTVVTIIIINYYIYASVECHWFAIYEVIDDSMQLVVQPPAPKQLWTLSYHFHFPNSM